MAISVNTNTSAMTAQNYLGQATNNLSVSMERLSSGLRINSAKDDAAGMQISNRLDAQFSGMNVAMRNANDAISMSQTAEGGLKNTASTLTRMRDLAVQATNGSNGKDERAALNQEVQDLTAHLNSVAETTSFGGQRLLNGEFGTKSFQVGADAGQAVMISLGSTRADETLMGGVLAKTADSVDADWKTTTTAGTALLSAEKDLAAGDPSDPATYDPLVLAVDAAKAALAAEAEAAKPNFSVSVTGTDGVTRKEAMYVPSGLDIEETATYINGHSDGLVSASVDVSETGARTLQFVAGAGDKITTEALTGLDKAGVAADITALTNAGDRTTINDIDISTAGGAQAAIGIIDQAIKYVDSTRADLGATQNRLDATVANLTNVSTNVAQSSSRIKDVDFASESVNLTKNQILQQSSAAILAQAKSSPQIALSLL